MLTKTDINNLIKECRKIFNTKEELKKETEKIMRSVTAHSRAVDLDFEALELRLEPLKRFEKIIEETNHRIVEFKDQILGEISALREEVTITVGYRGILEDHEIRINNLEKNRKSN